jgi:glycosyltransferase involved in cell wall biosynthesis
MRRKLLMVGRTRYRLPLTPSLERKFDALGDELDVRVLASRAPGTNGSDPRFRLVPRLPVLDSPSFYAALPFRVARELRSGRPDAVLVQGAQETALVLAARRLAGVETKVIADLHGDPGAPVRLYGSRARRALAPLADALARRAIRRADAVRTLSPFTTELVRARGVEPAGVFPAFMDLDAFLDVPPAPLPERSRALFVGVLERYKAVDVLAEAWRRVCERLEDGELHIVGRGALTDVVDALVRDLPTRTRRTPALETGDVARALDDATVLVLPSRSEGLPRIAVEAFCRGRAVVGSRAGGIPDLVVDRENGLLVGPEDPAALADALVSVLSDPALAERLGAAARRTADGWSATPEEYAQRVRELVDRVVEST